MNVISSQNGLRKSFSYALCSLILAATMSGVGLVGSSKTSADSTAPIVISDGTGNIYTSTEAGPATLIKATTGSTSPVSSNFATLVTSQSKIFYVTPASGSTPVDLRSMSETGTANTVVAKLPDQYYPFNVVWSASASKFVISDGGSQAYTISDSGTGYTKVFSGTAYAEAWSPNGAKLAIEGKSGVYVVNADGSDQKLVDAASKCHTTNNSNIAWSGNSVLFIGCNNTDDTSYSIVEYYAPSGLSTVYSAKGSTIDTLAVDPDGAYLSYAVTGPLGSSANSETIYTLEVIASGMQPNVPVKIYSVSQASEYETSAPIMAWSPASTGYSNSEFTFTGPNDINPAVHVSNISGSDLHEVLDTKTSNNPITALNW
jgi:hypothetical protein